MRRGEPFDRAQTQSHAVQADRKIGAHAFQHAAIVAAGTEVVLAMHLEPAAAGTKIGLRGHEIGVVPRPQPDARQEHAQRFIFSLAGLPGSPCLRLPPICTQVPVFTILKSFGS